MLYFGGIPRSEGDTLQPETTNTELKISYLEIIMLTFELHYP